MSVGTTTAGRFAEELQRAEQSKNVERLVELFDEQAILLSPQREAAEQGRDPIREFWRHYLENFGSIHSEFTRVQEMGGMCVLEWQSEGTFPNGRPFRYRGVSVLDLEEGRVKRFVTYYSRPVLERAE